MTRNAYQPGRTWVVKIGSSLLTAGGAGLDMQLVSALVDDIVSVYRSGVHVVLVSSGAVAEGMQRLGMRSRPRALHLLQAAAAVGQMGLIQAYESQFQCHNLHTAQILLTHDDLRSRERYINARSTLRSLLDLGVIPVINENDTVVTDEIRFGDNDTLAALVANLIDADTLLLLTDQAGFYSSDPRSDPHAQLIAEAKVSDPSLDKMAGDGGILGRGGMVTKLRAARTAARSGANTLISPGGRPGVITKLARGEYTGTLLRSNSEVMVARKQWLAALATSGRVVLDHGAVAVLRESGGSLLPVGVKAVHGDFTRGSMVACVDEAGVEVARGLVNYSASEVITLCGQSSSMIESLLGYMGEEELIHRDNLVIS
jgi:glutamate 5-kinase